MRFNRFLATVLLVVGPWGSDIAWGDPPGLAAVVEGVQGICSDGLSGSIYLDTTDWVPIAAASSGSMPSLVAAARQYGSGRVAILGHDGFVISSSVDTARFMRQLMGWLNVSAGNQARYSSGHAEWIRGTGLQPLAASLQAGGVTLQSLPAPITAEGLRSVSVLIVGNAWSDLSQSEIVAIRDWVWSGGGLLLPGLGWSWEDPSRGRSVENYPMAALAAQFGARWLTTAISGTAVTVSGSAVFDRFYPAVERVTVESALAWLAGAHSVAGDSLPATLRGDAALVRKFVEAHQLLAAASKSLPSDHPHRQQMAVGLESLFDSAGSFYRRDAARDPSAQSAAAWLRDRAWRSWWDALDYDSATIQRAVQVGAFRADRAQLLVERRVLLLDNSALAPNQVALIESHLDQIPWGLSGLRAISARDSLGTAPDGCTLDGRAYSVNIVSYPIGAVRETQFPAEVPASFADVYSTVLSHELGHIIDASGIDRTPELRAQKQGLIARAGDLQSNYLRSMLSQGFFTQNPQEFFASICNQWFTSGSRTLDVALARLGAGKREPLEQFLFISDVFSAGSDELPLFTANTTGTLTSTPARVQRDDAGRIRRMFARGLDLRIVRDGTGAIVGAERTAGSVADLDLSGLVDFGDVVIVLLNFGPCAGCETDLDGNGMVDFGDVVMVLLEFGEGA